VMRTGGCMGEVVGMAAAVCKEHDADPRAVYEDHLEELKERIRVGVGAPIPGIEPLEGAGENLARKAAVTTSGDKAPDAHPASLVNDGTADWLRNDVRWLSHAEVPNWVEFGWPSPVRIAAVRVLSGFHSGATVDAPIESFVLQTWDGSDWLDVPETDTEGNTDVAWQCRFEPLATTRARLLVRKTQIDVSRIWEIELYAPVEE